MSELKPSWTLKEEVTALPMSPELREQVDLYIKNNDGDCTGKPYQFSNLYYRANLHYIIDNIDKAGLLKELTDLNQKQTGCS